MILTHINSNSDCNKQIRAFIQGWSKLRGHSGVSIQWEDYSAHCEFLNPIGNIQRKKESFFWNFQQLNFEKLRSMYANEFHFLSVFGVNKTLHEQILNEGYSVLTSETQMFCRLINELHSSGAAVKVISTLEQVDWYNRQRDKIVISKNQFLDRDIYDFYTEDNGILTSFARGICVNEYMVIDDVQTKPEYRRQGLATTILSTIKTEAHKRKLNGLTLISSEAGSFLYAKNNFQTEMTLTVYTVAN